MRETKILPCRKYLNECFEYQSDGSLIWRERPLSHFNLKWVGVAFNTKNSGNIAGTSQPDGYVNIGLNRQIYKAHRLIYAMNFDDLTPDNYIDHINGIVFDNRICNLRIATKAQNSGNVKRRSDNLSGEKGVWWCNSKKIWIAQVQVKGTKYNKGFSSLVEASFWVKNKRVELHGIFHNHGIH